MDNACFQWKVRKYQIQEKFRTELNARHVSEIKNCLGKSRTDGHLKYGTTNWEHVVES